MGVCPWKNFISETFGVDVRDKFHTASTDEEKVELFNPLYIRRLATNGHMDPETAAVVIPKLLSMTLIRRSQQTVINGKRIGEEIPPNPGHRGLSACRYTSTFPAICYKYSSRLRHLLSILGSAMPGEMHSTYRLGLLLLESPSSP
ncbi:hypothetical protein FQN50_000389 [Emmonsiellopsis sp. PD_5]|nr:hypothetical protein FQN50_000389 [Emmonsiellopsis sp. PD_5]